MRNINNKKTLNKERSLKICDKIRDRIFLGHYMPRQHLVESELSKDLGVNRSLVREALKRLIVEGLVITEPYKGCTVAKISVRDAYETFQVEAVLEGFAASLAASQIRDEDLKKIEKLVDKSKLIKPKNIDEWERYNRHIHKAINMASRNKRILSLIKYNFEFSKYWFIAMSTPEQVNEKNEDHEKIFNAIKERKPLKARRLVEKHVMDGAEDIKKRLNKILPT